MTGLPPPNDLEAEAAVLSACFLKPEDFDQVAEILEPRDFYSDANRHIWQAALDMAMANEPLDLVTLAGTLRDRGKLDKCGGTPYLVQIINSTPAVAHVLAHARRVRELSRLRQAIALNQRFIAEAYECQDVQEHLEQHEHAIFQLGMTAERSEVEHVSESNQRAIKTMLSARARGDGVTGTPTGIVELDKMLSGLHPGDLTILAARPGMGKSALAFNIAVNVALGTAQHPSQGVAAFSLEMPKEQLSARMLATDARVDLKHIRSGKIPPDDWQKLTESAARLNKIPLWLDDTPGLSIVQLRSKIRRASAMARNAKNKLGLVVVDYLQLMRGLDRRQTRDQQVGEISGGLKQIAKELEVPVLALSQLNRSVETRGTKDKRPQLSDLRESGAIEQDADTIMFIYRDEYYNRDSPDRGIAEIIVAKQRNGPTGMVRAKYTPAYTRFDNLADDDYEFEEYDRNSGWSGEDYADKVSP